MTECGQKVVVLQGQWKADDGQEVGMGEVGWVVGHRGMDYAVIHFDSGEEGRVAEVPIRHLRVLTPRTKGR